MSVSHPVQGCAELVRAADYDRYLSVLFAPKDKRASLFALYAFNYEVAKTAETVTEPTLGLIRLQWWREALDGIYSGTPRRHEVVEALFGAVVAFGLPRKSLDAIINARENDLSPTPFTVVSELETYADATSGNVMRLAARILASGADVDDHARAFGTAYAITGLLRAFPFHAAARRFMFPLREAAALGLNEGDIFSGRAHNIRTLTDSMAALAERHMNAGSARTPPRRALPAFLPAALIRPYLKVLRGGGFDPYRHPVDLSIPRKQWAILSALVKGRL